MPSVAIPMSYVPTCLSTAHCAGTASPRSSAGRPRSCCPQARSAGLAERPARSPRRGNAVAEPWRVGQVEPAGGHGRAQLREEPRGRERRPPEQGILRRRGEVAQRWCEAWLGEVGYEPAQPRARVREAGLGAGSRERVKQLDEQPRIDLDVRGEGPDLPG